MGGIQEGQPSRWDLQTYVAAWEAGVLPDGVELIDGELSATTPTGDWHGETLVEVIAALRRTDVVVTTSTLVLGAAAPDPDLSVRRAAALPVGQVGSRLSVWDVADLVLVVELSDAPQTYDLNVKADLYSRAGVGCYWVVTDHNVIVHTDPGPDGYGARSTVGPGGAVPYLDGSIEVDELIGRQAPHRREQ